MKFSSIVIIVGLILLVGVFAYRKNTRIQLPEGETSLLIGESRFGTIQGDNTVVDVVGKTQIDEEIVSPEIIKEKQIITENKVDVKKADIVVSSNREIFVTDNVKHSVLLKDIRQGCYGRDCIPSVDDPEFVSITEANKILSNSSIGIGLSYNGETRFYPFDMLVTREIVNDVVGGEPLVVTYCPLCGTGIVFDRTIDGKVFEFGVSGMLWQSNLLMYNRENNETEISLWSQVLGEAVLGNHTGKKLKIIRSDIIRYSDWKDSHPKTKVLNTGRTGDPYRGDYYSVARSFNPDFDENSSPVLPTAYVVGIEIGGKYKAYVKDSLKVGITEDNFNGVAVKIDKNTNGEIKIINSKDGSQISLTQGFWFSWVSAHPETELLK